jgi:hypothetical protein
VPTAVGIVGDATAVTKAIVARAGPDTRRHEVSVAGRVALRERRRRHGSRLRSRMNPNVDAEPVRTET